MTTGPDGSFAFRGLRDDSLFVRASKGGWLPGEQANVRPGATDVILTLSPCSVIHGRVLDSTTNKPLSDFVMSPRVEFPMAEASARPRVLRGGDAAAAAGVPEVPGLFAVADVPDKTIRLDVRAAGFAQAVLGPVRAGSGEHVEVDALMTPEASIEGIVRSPDGTPLSGARVIASTKDSNHSLRSGPCPEK